MGSSAEWANTLWEQAQAPLHADCNARCLVLQPSTVSQLCTSPVCGTKLGSDDAVADVLQLLEHLARAAVQLLSHLGPTSWEGRR